MTSGTGPNTIDHRDRSFHKSFKTFGAVAFPTEYFVDSGEEMPDQNQVNTFFTPPVPPLPEGCTDYTTAEIATDLNHVVYNPWTIEGVTYANQRGGVDIRESLMAGRNLKWFKGFYNVQAGITDFFDSFRLTQVGARPETTSISWGTPWFPSWEVACNASINPSGIMPMPTEAELNVAHTQPWVLPWHNSKLDGWTSKDGIVVYRDKSWQGNIIGDKGFVYFPREVINTVMTIRGTVAYVVTNETPDNILPIDVTAVQWLISFFRNLFGLH